MMDGKDLVPVTEVEGDRVYRVTYLTGVMELEPIEHVLTWLDYDSFEVRSEYMTMTGCRAEDLGMVLSYMRPITFANERPERPNWLSRVRAALTQISP
jgi:hypothetical protein